MMDFFEKVVRVGRNLINLIILYLPGVSIVGILAYCVVGLPEAQDIIIYSLEKPSGQLFTLFGLLFWSYMVWYSSRVMSSVGELKIVSRTIESNGEKVFPFEVALFPKLLGYSCFLVIHIGVMKLPIWNVPYFVILAYFIFHILFFIFEFRRDLQSKYGRKMLLFGFSLIQIIFLITLFFLTTDYSIKISFQIITYRSLLLFLAISSCLQGLMLILISDQNKSKSPFRFQSKILQNKKIGFLERLKDSHLFLLKKIGSKSLGDRDASRFMALNIISLLVIVVFLLVILLPRFSTFVGTFAILLFSLSFLVGLLNLIRTFSRKFNIHFNIILFVLILLFSTNKDIYEVRYNSIDQEKMLIQKQASMKSFTEGWIKERRSLFEKDSIESINVYLVLNDGGASRAGYWGASVLALLDDTTRGEFGNQIFAISGASGGSVGNSVYYALKKDNTSNLSKSVAEFFSTDFLSYPAAHLLGYDLYGYYLLNFFGNSFQNRADALERGLEKLSPLDKLNFSFSSPLEEVYDYEGKLPAFLMATTSVGDGKPYIISNVKLPNAFQGNFAEVLCPTKSINYSTAAILSSRFPYFSPAGKVGDRYFVDGGYIDNSGAFAMLSFIRKFEGTIPDLDSAYQSQAKRLRFQVIRLYTGDPSDNKAFSMSGISNDLFSPLFTLGGMQSSSTKSGLNQLELFLKESTLQSQNPKVEFNFQNMVNGDNPDYKDTYFPMSWSISKWYRVKFDSALNQLIRDKDFVVLIN